MVRLSWRLTEENATCRRESSARHNMHWSDGAASLSVAPLPLLVFPSWVDTGYYNVNSSKKYFPNRLFLPFFVESRTKFSHKPPWNSKVRVILCLQNCYPSSNLHTKKIVPPPNPHLRFWKNINPWSPLLTTDTHQIFTIFL